MSEYSELLRNPQWQQKRLLVMDRDHWACQKCTNTFENLQVHHLYYKADTLPWEYPDDALITVCDLCHEKTEFVKWLFREGPKLLQKDRFDKDEVRDILKLINRRLLQNHHKESARRYMESIKSLING